MSKNCNTPTGQNQRRTAFLALGIICFKSLLPLLTAVLFSQTVAASPSLLQFSNPALPTTEAFESEASIETALQFICTPAGLKPVTATTAPETDHSDPGSVHNHCDHCITAGYLGLTTTSFLSPPRWDKPEAVVWKNHHQLFLQPVADFLSAPRAPPVG
ncbi:hypothetical protein [Kiloniella laminariae]|uniref:hypothetical protein n=1 Tax=Kiloniella laminariae TaxID=454162 RepID=UPI00037202D4|nr:hypothetical protein [Kiloniella laminariae]